MKGLLKMYLGIVACSLVGVGSVYAQSETDAFSLSRTEIDGSARFQAMGGAFAALGGDLSSISQNPAGGAVFHRSEMSMSFGFSNRATTASWYNQESKQSLSNVKIPQIGFISSYYNPTTGNGFSFGISRNRVVSYDRDFEAETNPKGTLLDYNGVKGIPFSIADYTAMITPDDLRYDSFYDPQKGGLYDANASWMTILGYEAGFINPGAGGAGPYTTNFYYPDGSGSKVPFGPKRATLRMQERGAVNAYDFNLGYNWGDRCYLGASLKYTSVERQLASTYGEDFSYDDYLQLYNELATTGSGFGLSIGAILRPTDGLRIGLAFHSPTWLSLVDRYYATARTRYTSLTDDGKTIKKVYNFKGKTPKGSNSYFVTTPSRFVVGLAYTFGNRALISVDYDLMPYSMMRLKFPGTVSAGSDNRAIESHYGWQHTVRVGGELRILPSLSLRLGGAYSTTPMKPGNGLTSFEGSSQTPMLVAGTLPHYTIQKTQWIFGGGFGYRFSKAFYIDASLVRAQNNSDVYAFPALADRSGAPLKKDVFATPNAIKLSNSNIRATITFGYKF